jgi:hypothetical protein
MADAAFVLTEAGSVTCGTNGAAALESDAKLTVGGAAAVMRPGDIVGATISGCTTSVTNTTTTCATVAAVTGEATKLSADGKPVALGTLSGASSGNHPPPSSTTPPAAALNATAGQAKLRAR